MDQVDRQLLTAAQRGIPLVPDPFAALGAELNLGGEEVRTRLARLREAKVVRQISAIFDSGRLGYKTSLVAMKLPAERLQAAAELINLHPGVSHNYRRNHDFNLWFTIAVPPGRDLQEEVAVLAEHVRAESCRPLPTLRLFKIGVHFDLAGEGSDGPAQTAAPAPAPTTASAEPLGADLRQVVAVLQRHLPLVDRPFAALSAEAPGAPLDEAQLLAAGERLKREGYMRRYAAVLHHRRAGFSANGMGVWTVPDEQAEEVGLVMASYPAVSHCYQRPAYPDWPYTHFTMIHGTSPADCEEVAAAISRRTGLTDYHLLYSDVEYKKVRVRYFTEDDEFDPRGLPFLD